MLRIVWGFIFIVCGLFVVGQVIVGISLLQLAAQLSGQGASITHEMLSKANFYSSVLFGVGLCLGGSLLVYYGDAVRQDRLEHIIDLLAVRKKSNKDGDW